MGHGELAGVSRLVLVKHAGEARATKHSLRTQIGSSSKSSCTSYASARSNSYLWWVEYSALPPGNLVDISMVMTVLSASVTVYLSQLEAAPSWSL